MGIKPGTSAWIKRIRELNAEMGGADNGGRLTRAATRGVLGNLKLGSRAAAVLIGGPLAGPLGGLIVEPLVGAIVDGLDNPPVKKRKKKTKAA